VISFSRRLASLHQRSTQFPWLFLHSSFDLAWRGRSYNQGTPHLPIVRQCCNGGLTPGVSCCRKRERRRSGRWRQSAARLVWLSLGEDVCMRVRPQFMLWATMALCPPHNGMAERSRRADHPPVPPAGSVARPRPRLASACCESGARDYAATALRRGAPRPTPDRLRWPAGPLSRSAGRGFRRRSRARACRRRRRTLRSSP
jgi:hypothetical protein